jgi:hypothetical protein
VNAAVAGGYQDRSPSVVVGRVEGDREGFDQPPDCIYVRWVAAQQFTACQMKGETPDAVSGLKDFATAVDQHLNASKVKMRIALRVAGDVNWQLSGTVWDPQRTGFESN